MIFADESRQPAPEVTPEQGRLLTSFWSAAERSMWMSRPGKVHKNARFCARQTTGISR